MSTEAHAIWASPEDPAFAAFAAREVAGDATLFDGALLIAHWLAGASVEDACEAPLAACCEAASRWVAPRFDAATNGEGLVTALATELGYAGDQDHYGALENSRIDQVLARKRGLPITLAALYSEVGRRLGVALTGINAPGHFVLAMSQDPRVWLDPFAGTTLQEAAFRERLRSQGAPAVVLSAPFRPCDPRGLVLRMLANIQQQQSEQRAWALALRASGARRRLAPAQLSVLFDHVQLLQRAGQRHEAEAALQAVLPSLEGRAAELVMAWLAQLQRGQTRH